MAEEITENEISHAFITVTKNGEELAAGVTLAERKKLDDGRPYYESTKVLSLYINNDQINSINDAIKYAIAKTISEVPEEKKLLVVRGVQGQFNKSRRLIRRLYPTAQMSGLDLKIFRVKRANRKFEECYDLSKDALNRKGSIVVEI